MDTERWQRLSPLLDALFELDEEERERSLRLMREEDPQTADDLEALLRLETDREDFLSEPLVAPLPGQLPARHGVQLLVQGGEHAIERAAISIAGGIQQLGDVGSLGHGPLNGPEYSPDCEARHGVSALHRPRKPEFPC